jgi:hypothetical protein
MSSELLLYLLPYLSQASHIGGALSLTLEEAGCVIGKLETSNEETGQHERARLTPK